MKKDELYKYLKLMYKDKLVLLKTGTFYHTFNEDAIILSSVFNYQIINNRCSTPISNKEKVKNKLKELNIDIVFVNNDSDIEEIINEYNKYGEYIEEIEKKKEFDKKMRDLIEMITDKIKENYDNYNILINFAKTL